MLCLHAVACPLKGVDRQWTYGGRKSVRELPASAYIYYACEPFEGAKSCKTRPRRLLRPARRCILSHEPRDLEDVVDAGDDGEKGHDGVSGRQE